MSYSSQNYYDYNEPENIGDLIEKQMGYFFSNCKPMVDDGRILESESKHQKKGLGKLRKPREFSS